MGIGLIGLLKAMGSYYSKFELKVVIFSLIPGYTAEMEKYQFDFLVAVAAAAAVGAREKENNFCHY